jgi:hypothetical protein
MPIAFDFYSVLAASAALLLGILVLAAQMRGDKVAPPQWQRAAMHFTIALLVALAVLLPPYAWLPPLAPLPLVYFWQVALAMAVVILLRTIPRLRAPGAPRPLRLYILAAFYTLAVLISLVFNLFFNIAADVLTLVSFALLGHLFAGIATLLPPAPAAGSPPANR